ncbi:maltose alpha-D-glucosyltransferase domain protein [Mycobacterium xenopi 3993]|nr:maltose alpha-D-glucosyltransferase domain protein [Mycobacterium xenopi 3993]
MGIFLRNHDELTLEMVTDEERDYMYSEYAKDPRMKANVGIRRRLASLLEKDRNQIELFTALLLSLPARPSFITVTRSAWVTSSGSVIATACAPRCSGHPTATPGFPPPTRAGCICRPSRTRFTAIRPSMSKRNATPRRRC